MRTAKALAGLAALSITAPAEAATIVQFDIRPGRLSEALIRLGEQAGITIGANDPALVRIPSPAIHGRMSLQSALARLLAGTGYDYRMVGAGAVRIVRSAPLPRPGRDVQPALPKRQSASPPAEDLIQEIIVTASKLGVALDRFGGTVHLMDLKLDDGARLGARGSEAILSRMPMLAATSLGPGRNKLYIRGVADSSFNGPSQSIVGEYLGDVRLTFNAPDPEIPLYDVKRVELLEGPQGTLYGSGSLGGILRLVPNEPNPTRFAGAGSIGWVTTRHGAQGGDLSAMLNVPIVRDTIAARALAYSTLAPGYIDDLGRGLKDVNRTSAYGGRAAISIDPGDDWKLEVGALVQQLSGRDGQYASFGSPPLTRRTNLAQPYDNDYWLGHFTVRKHWNGTELVSATSIVNHVLQSKFDATGFPGTAGPQLFAENVGITLMSNETRLSKPHADGNGWIAGWSVIHDINRISRRLGIPSAPAEITGVRNETTEAALFGQYSFGVTPSLTATGGGRLTYSEAVGRPLGAPEEGLEQPKRRDFRASPTLALSWQADERTLVYARFQNGFRAGGLAVAASGSTLSAQRFESDALTTVEAGMRFGHSGTDPFSFDAALSYANWADMQADLIDDRGLPYTTNLGNGQIYSFEAVASWKPSSGLGLDFALFLNDSSLYAPNPAFASSMGERLPNIANVGGRAAAHFSTALSASTNLTLDGAIRYVGQSQLGIGAPLDSSQGDFLEAEAGTRVDFGRLGVSIDVTNIGDNRGDRFAFGNPFTVADRLQTTPLRPRSIRIGVDVEF